MLTYYSGLSYTISVTVDCAAHGQGPSAPERSAAAPSPPARTHPNILSLTWAKEK